MIKKETEPMQETLHLMACKMTEGRVHLEKEVQMSSRATGVSSGNPKVMALVRVGVRENG